jgi:hypothetical protein
MPRLVERSKYRASRSCKNGTVVTALISVIARDVDQLIRPVQCIEHYVDQQITVQDDPYLALVGSTQRTLAGLPIS